MKKVLGLLMMIILAAWAGWFYVQPETAPDKFTLTKEQDAFAVQVFKRALDGHPVTDLVVDSMTFTVTDEGIWFLVVQNKRTGRVKYTPSARQFKRLIPLDSLDDRGLPLVKVEDMTVAEGITFIELLDKLLKTAGK